MTVMMTFYRSVSFLKKEGSTGEGYESPKRKKKKEKDSYPRTITIIFLILYGKRNIHQVYKGNFTSS